MACVKKKLDRIKALFIISQAQKQSKLNFNRNERRFYWCSECKSYHTTSKK